MPTLQVFQGHKQKDSCSVLWIYVITFKTRTMKTKKISIIRRITERILGKKFYIAVIAQKGTSTYYVNSTIYRSKEDVLKYKKHVDSLQSVVFVCYYSFRSRNDFRLAIGDGKAVDVEEAKKLANK